MRGALVLLCALLAAACAPLGGARDAVAQATATLPPLPEAEAGAAGGGTP